MKKYLGAIVLLLMMALPGFGQGNTGTILGTVIDSSGAIVPQARITVLNVETGIVTNIQSDQLGNYRAQFLPPGSYTVEAESGGFKKFKREPFRLELNRELRIDVTLEPGVNTQTLTVTSEVPLVETETGSLSTTIENRLVTTLPMLGRNPQNLKMVVPGITGSGIASGGMLRRDTYFVDGGQVMLHVFGGEAVNPNPDVIQEFKVMTNAFSAEYGETSGFILQATTKSGTNSFHGTLFEFFRNDKLNAGNYYSHDRSILRFNQFGGTVGGPIVKNKSFFFFSTQLKRQIGMSQWNNLTVPVDAVKRGDFSSFLGARVGTDVLGRQVFQNQIFDPLSSRTVKDAAGRDVVVRDPFDGNRIPVSRMSPAALKLQALYPTPKFDGTYTNYAYAASSRLPEDTYDIKIDHNFSDRDKLMGRYSIRSINNQQPQPLPNPLAGGANAQGPLYYERGQQLVLNPIHIFGPRATNDLHVSFFRRNVERKPVGYGEVGTEDFGIRGMPNGKEKLGTPNVTFGGVLAPVALGNTNGTLILEPQHSGSIVNITSIIRDRHNIKFGGELRQLRMDNFQPFPYNTSWSFTNIYTDQVGIARTGIDYASFLLGLPRAMTYNVSPSFIQPRTAIYALFVQDDIRVSRKLTVNAGLRWDAPLYFHEKKNRSGIFDLDKGEYVQFGTNGFRTTNWEQDWINFGPRIGFAFTPFTGSNVVLRGAYGIFAVGVAASGRAGGMPLSPIFSDGDVGRYTTTDQINWKTTLDSIPYEVADKTGRNAASVAVYPAKNSTSYYQQWNFNVQNQVKGFMFEVGWVGSRGVHLPYGAYDMNVIPTNMAGEARGRFISPFVPYPKYPNGVDMQSWIGSSIYHSLQAKVERRMSSGLGILMAYTWAKMIATGDSGYRDAINNRNLDRGVTADSPPHRLTMAYTYQMPLGKGRRWLTKGPLTYPLGGWELSGINTFESGYPLTPGTTYNSCVCGAANRPNVSGDPRLGSSERTLDRWFNTSVFSQASLYSIGNAGRSLFLGPGTVNLDASLMKRFYLPGQGETRNIEFRGEFFNLTNTPRFGNPNVTVGAGTVGRITSASGARQVQLALKFYW
ncbi:MAG: carboxypeptidase regulatory-like domain-containing protein [Bryobacterales bacterium]|nr:carboxypeptidase regulatory-like domain-containing protein [Bryobacterales bacterium]